MGIKIFSEGPKDYSRPIGALSPDWTEPASYNPQPPEPDARKFTIREAKGVNGWTVAIVNYPGCTTYDGNKCLVFACPPGVVTRQELLDPHFLERGDMLSPIARFEPTPRGIELAIQLCANRK